MFQSKLIKFCAPTLAGIKCGSLFKFKTQYTLYTDELINRYNTIYNKDGIFFFNLFQRNNYVLTGCDEPTSRCQTTPSM